MKKKTATRQTGVVTTKEFLSPHLIRIKLKVEAIHEFQNATIGDNNKILVPPPGVNKIYFPETDPETGAPLVAPEHLTPVRRTYTHSGIDLDRGEIFIDFVHHGDNGPASAWALNCEVGDVLGIMMRTHPKELFPTVDHLFLIGDATALPAIMAMLKQASKQTRVTAIIEVHGQEDQLELPDNDNINIHWLHNQSPEKGSKLAEKAMSLPLPEESRFAFVAAEFDTVKELRNYFRKEKQWDRTELSAYSYWRSGVAEDRSEKDRRQERAAMQ